MIAWLLWRVFRAFYGAGVDVTEAMLDGIERAIREEWGP